MVVLREADGCSGDTAVEGGAWDASVHKVVVLHHIDVHARAHRVRVGSGGRHLVVVRSLVEVNLLHQTVTGVICSDSS